MSGNDTIVPGTYRIKSGVETPLLADLAAIVLANYSVRTDNGSLIIEEEVPVIISTQRSYPQIIKRFGSEVNLRDYIQC